MHAATKAFILKSSPVEMTEENSIREATTRRLRKNRLAKGACRASHAGCRRFDPVTAYQSPACQFTASKPRCRTKAPCMILVLGIAEREQLAPHLTIAANCHREGRRAAGSSW